MNELLAKLLGLIPEEKQSEYKEIESGLLEIETNLTALLKNANDSESSLKADKTKAEASLLTIKTLLGSDEYEKVIKELKDTSISGDDKLKAKQTEIEALQLKQSELETKIESDKLKFVEENLTKDILSYAPTLKASPDLVSYLTADIVKMATIKDGETIFKDEHGNTLLSKGKMATYREVLESLKQKEIDSKKGVFFDIAPQQTNSNNNGGTPLGQQDTRPKF